jgi:hypothetical protein
MEFQCLEERFDLKGSHVFAGKHQTYIEIAEDLKDSITDYKFFTIVREPIDRLLSLYFSPHRWMVKSEAGAYVKMQPKFVEMDFQRLISTAPAMIQYVCKSINNTGQLEIVFPDDLTVLKYEKFEQNISNFCQKYDLSLNKNAFTHRVNASNEQSGLKDDSRKSEIVQDLVKRSHHKFDYKLFGYS